MAANLQGGVEMADGAVEVLRQTGADAEQVVEGDLRVAADAADGGHRPQQQFRLGPVAAVHQGLGLDHHALDVGVAHRGAARPGIGQHLEQRMHGVELAEAANHLEQPLLVGRRQLGEEQVGTCAAFLPAGPQQRLQHRQEPASPACPPSPDAGTPARSPAATAPGTLPPGRASAASAGGYSRSRKRFYRTSQAWSNSPSAWERLFSWRESRPSCRRTLASGF